MKRFTSMFVLILFLFFSLSTFLVPHAEAAEDSWATMAEMPTARAGLGVAVVNGKIYAIGGYNGSTNYLRTNEMYDPETDAWTTKTSMPTPRAFFGIAVYQNKIYVIGGRTRGDYTYTGVNEVYDPLTDTWETRTPIPTLREGFDANVVNGKIYLIGGMRIHLPGYSIQTFNLNEFYDPSTDTWTAKTPLPTAVYAYTSAVIDNKIYVIGGSGGTLNQIYTPETDIWNNGTPIPYSSTYGAGAATTGNMAPKRIYIIGGGDIIPSSANRIYDPERDVWSTGTPMPTARNLLDVAVVDDVLYAIGGVRGAIGGVYGTNEQYSPVGYGTVPPTISIVSPENKTYTVNNVSLTFNVSEPISWIGYSLDGQANVTISGNTTLSGLSYGSHNLTVYAKDNAGNTGASETIYFNIRPLLRSFPPEPFPTWIVITIVIIVVVGVALLVYFVKVKKTTGKAE